jgi:acyl-CoA synthetase (AMP-forming)/AMP-acid ligase II
VATTPVDEPCDGFDVDTEDVAVTLFTSGTTGTPKAALLRHRHLVNYIVSTVEFFACDEDEAILVSVPNYHIAGLASVLSSTYSGRRMVQLPGFAPDQWAQTAAAESITHAMLVPTMLGRVLDELEARGEKLSSLRSLSYGGGRMPVPVLQRALGQLPHVDFVNAYGLTETSSTVSVLSPDDHRVAIASDDPAVRARLGSVGCIMPSLELEVRDDSGRVQPPGSPGEIFVRGEQIAGEYSTHSALVEGGWYPTNDRGYVDDDGYLFLDGRADDIIVRGGENISPGEIEDVLRAHPSVVEAAVVGVADSEWGERVEAAVVLADGASLDAQALKESVRAALRSTRVPDRIHPWTELPHNETGKLLRRQIRADMEAPTDREDQS